MRLPTRPPLLNYLLVVLCLLFLVPVIQEGLGCGEKFFC